MNMNTRYIRLSAVLATAISLTACSFSSLDVDKKAHDYGYNVADENGYIKSFNVGTAAKVEPETKTLFHTEEGSYGLTTWEPGHDVLSFILRDPTGQGEFAYNDEHWQKFGCESSFEKDSYEGPGDIKWAKYTVLDDNIGLQLGGNYYAYYMDGQEELAIQDIEKGIPINIFSQNGQSDESLQNFMRENDILVLEQDQHGGSPMENGGLIIESPMRDVYMEHYFSLIEVDVHWVQDPEVTYTGRGGKIITERVPYNNQFVNCRFGSGASVEDDSDTPEEQKAFGKNVWLNDFGQLEILKKTSLIDNVRKDSKKMDLMLNETNKVLKYYFLIHPIKPSNHYWIKVYVSDGTISYPRTIHYELPKEMMFKPGYYYKFDLDADFTKMDSQDMVEWSDNGELRDRNVDQYKAKGIRVYDQNN